MFKNLKLLSLQLTSSAEPINSALKDWRLLEIVRLGGNASDVLAVNYRIGIYRLSVIDFMMP
jgi:hypothetical protein